MAPAELSYSKEAVVAMLPEIVDSLQRMVTSDWPELDVQVQVTDDGLISMSFPMQEMESDFGVLAYMNTFNLVVFFLRMTGYIYGKFLGNLRRSIDLIPEAVLGV